MDNSNEVASPILAQRKLPVGAEPHAGGGVHFRVWAPLRTAVDVEIEGNYAPLNAEKDGYFAGIVPGARAGTRYRYRLDGKDSFPDPASRYQPDGPHGPSEVVDASRFSWSDDAWTGPPRRNNVIYELHVGTFTREGTWQAAAGMLPYLAETGFSIIEIMPIADFSGRFGWGYDGVNWFAPTRLYGSPDDMRRFVDSAHALGMGVILDVVYNHLGPDGNYIGQFSSDYITKKHTTDWGDAINYDGRNSKPVREFVAANAGYWIDEFHLDGLRLDATQNIYDDGPDHILAAITRSVRKAARGRNTFVVAENEPQETRLARPEEQGGYGMDGLWNDDYHHSALVAMAGRSEAYYTDYLGNPQELLSAAKYGYLYQGQWYEWQEQRRGTPTRDLPRSAFVTFIENHDQVANSARGLRAHQVTSPAIYRAMAAFTILGPGTPMLFQGQEFNATAPFLFFADMPEWLGKLVREGRREFMTQWKSVKNSAMLERLADPLSDATFARCKVDHSEKARNPEAYHFHCDLIRLRRTDPVLSADPSPEVDGAVLSARAFILRYFAMDGGDRLLVVNLGSDLTLRPAPEPLLAPPPIGRSWVTLLSTEHPDYGGSGSMEPDQEERHWMIPGQAAVLLGPGPAPVTKSRKAKGKKEKGSK